MSCLCQSGQVVIYTISDCLLHLEPSVHPHSIFSASSIPINKISSVFLSHLWQKVKLALHRCATSLIDRLMRRSSASYFLSFPPFHSFALLLSSHIQFTQAEATFCVRKGSYFVGERESRVNTGITSHTTGEESVMGANLDLSPFSTFPV